jgi:hypothetical protein
MNGMQSFILVILALVGMNTTGCSQSLRCPEKGANKEQLLKYLESGFDKEYPRLFWDRLPGEGCSRMSLLLEHLGYGGFKWDTFDVSSDYSQIHLWSWDDRKSVLTVSRDKPPELATLAGIPLFPKQRGYFCQRDGYDPQRPKKLTEDSTWSIYSDGDLNSLVAKIQFGFFPDRTFATKDRLYFVGRDLFTLPNDVNCHVYRLDSGKLLLEKVFTIKCPRKIGARWLFPEDFDDETKQVVLSLGTDNIYSLCSQYVYDMDSGTLQKVLKHRLCLTCPHGRFLDRDIFKKILKGTE